MLLQLSWFTDDGCIIALSLILAKSAVGAHVVSSMEGIQTLRSLSVEQRFLHKFDVYQDRSTAACYLHLAANRWEEINYISSGFRTFFFQCQWVLASADQGEVTTVY